LQENYNNFEFTA